MHVRSSAENDGSVGHLGSRAIRSSGHALPSAEAPELVLSDLDGNEFHLSSLREGPLPGREDEWPYETDWLTEVRGFGAEHYYPPIDA
jgi:hypothetical protein